MILARDQHMPRVLVEHRMVGAVVTELHLHRPRTRREPEQLVAKTDAERRHAAVNKIADRPNRVIAWLGIAWTVRKEDPAGAQRADVGRGRARRHDGQLAAALREQPQDVVLRAVVVRDDVKTRFARRAVTFAERPRAAAPL